MEAMKLYQAALDSIKRYKEEELTDFDEFMDEIEKEYCSGKYKKGQPQ